MIVVVNKNGDVSAFNETPNEDIVAGIIRRGGVVIELSTGVSTQNIIVCNLDEDSFRHEVRVR